ncbi:KH domain-containing protein [Candidatus Micrarchaeota archaeon]|nr:KH domain-containing protein [Candidatus Micrarchaeota archaeon]MBU1166226.1 KH domain-containing protein [Candidatus Micrarchaeota archaeon]MBU1886199.1 KH domain-containing protein [Candidatus Micrarchaeota archaeon]
MIEDEIEIIKIPVERVHALIGKNGAIKRTLEKKCKVTLNISDDGEVQIEGDPQEVFFAKDVVKAIGRGFATRDALRLINGDYVFYIIPLKEFLNSDKAITRMKSRVIGENGSIKSQIEHSTDSFLSIYGNTISIIARLDTIEHAKEAIGMLLSGTTHSGVLNYLSKTRRGVMQARLRDKY